MKTLTCIIFYITTFILLISKSVFAQPTYKTGTSAGDNKLKVFETKMNALDKNLEQYKLFLSSNEIYDFKTHYYILIEGEGENMILKHRFIERDLLLPLDDIEKGKMYTKQYSFAAELKRHEDFVKEYINLKQNSNQRALGHSNSKEKVEYESSLEYRLEQERNQKMFSTKPEENLTTDFQNKNVGKIIFSDNQTSKENSQINSKNTFNHKDNIYARAYFQKGLWNTIMYNENGDSISYMDYQDVMIYTNVYVDGIKQELKIEQDVSDDAAFCKARTRQLWLHPLVSDGLTEINWIKIIAAMNLGSHKIRLEFCTYNFDDTGKHKNTFSRVIAIGEFTLNKTDNQLPQIGKKWSSIPAGVKNSALESKALTIAKKNTNIDNMSSQEIKILDADWRIRKNELTGNIMYRYMRILLKSSHPDGYCYSIPMEIKQEYSGNSNYSSNLLLVGLASPDFGFDGYIDCE